MKDILELLTMSFLAGVLANVSVDANETSPLAWVFVGCMIMLSGSIWFAALLLFVVGGLRGQDA